MVSTLPFMDFYDILCARILLNYMAMPRTVEILTSAAALGKASIGLTFCFCIITDMFSSVQTVLNYSCQY